MTREPAAEKESPMTHFHSGRYAPPVTLNDIHPHLTEAQIRLAIARVPGTVEGVSPPRAVERWRYDVADGVVVMGYAYSIVVAGIDRTALEAVATAIREACRAVYREAKTRSHP